MIVLGEIEIDEHRIETTIPHGDLVRFLDAIIHDVQSQILPVVAIDEVVGIMIGAEVLPITIGIGVSMTTDAITMKRKMNGTDRLDAQDGIVGDGIRHPPTRLKKRMIGDAIEVPKRVVVVGPVADAEDEVIDDRNDAIQAHRRCHPSKRNGGSKSRQWRWHLARE